MSREGPDQRLPVGILGATGAVGQRLVERLDGHPWFRLAELVASERSAGRVYDDAVRWRLPRDVPDAVAPTILAAPGASLRSPILFSALGRDAALELEPLYAGRGHAVVSNASAFRDDPQIPLVIPEVNPHAIEAVGSDPRGLIVTNPNCCVVGLTLALAPLERAFGIAECVVATLQALSGAGLPGHPALEALGNVIPDIPGEADKIRREPLRLLQADFPIAVAVHRVPVADGHTLAVFLRLRRPASPEAATRALLDFTGPPPADGLPSAPRRPLRVLERADRPQPLLDAGAEGGMVVTVGPVTREPPFDLRFTVVVHNTIRGAAGAAVLNAELLVATLGRERLGGPIEGADSD